MERHDPGDADWTLSAINKGEYNNCVALRKPVDQKQGYQCKRLTFLSYLEMIRRHEISLDEEAAYSDYKSHSP
jgi:hypothetical protein